MLHDILDSFDYWHGVSDVGQPEEAGQFSGLQLDLADLLSGKTSEVEISSEQAETIVDLIEWWQKSDFEFWDNEATYDVIDFLNGKTNEAKDRPGEVLPGTVIDDLDVAFDLFPDLELPWNEFWKAYFNEPYDDVPELTTFDSIAEQPELAKMYIDPHGTVWIIHPDLHGEGTGSTFVAYYDDLVDRWKERQMSPGVRDMYYKHRQS